MHITPQEAIHWDFVVKSANMGAEPIAKGSKPYDAMVDQGELAIIMRPARSYPQSLKDWMTLCYAPDDYVYKHIGIKYSVWNEMHEKLLKNIVPKSGVGNIYPLSSMIIENFIYSEHCGKSLYSRADYCKYAGIHQSNYQRDWALNDDLICCYLRDLSNDVLEPIRRSIINLRQVKRKNLEDYREILRAERIKKSA